MNCKVCGTPAEPSWVYCAGCSAKLADQVADDAAVIDDGEAGINGEAGISVEAAAAGRSATPASDAVPTSRAWPLAATLFGVAAAATTIALFPAFFRHFSSLSSEPKNLALQLPAITGWSCAAVLIAVRRPNVRTFGVGLGVTLSALYATAFLPSLVEVLNGQHIAGAGFWWAFGGIAAALWALVLCVGEVQNAGASVARRPGPSRRIGLLAVAATVVYVGASLSDWSQIRLRATLRGTRTTQYQRCCALVHEHGWVLASQVALVSIGVLFAVIAVTFTRSRSLAAGMLLGVGLGLAGNPLGEIVRLAQQVTPASLGISAAVAKQADVSSAQQPLIGLWIAVASVVVIVVLAVVQSGRPRSRHVADER
jgi:hypothetical protein